MKKNQYSLLPAALPSESKAPGEGLWSQLLFSAWSRERCLRAKLRMGPLG